MSAQIEAPSLYATHASTFMQFPTLKDLVQSDAEVVVTGVPFDLACSGRSGTRLGPRAIRLASSNLIWEGERWPWTFALDDHLKVEDAGDLAFRYGEPATLVENLIAHADRVLASGKRMLTLGGDHFISLPLLRAHARHHGPVALIHFDAHTDTYRNGTQYDHGTIFHHAVVEGLVDPSRSIQVGIRTTYDRTDHAFEVLDAAWVNEKGPEAVLQRIRERVGGHQAYVSFDIDGLDPSCAPGTGTPVAGGMSMDCALKLIRGLVGSRLIGMDLVEVNPAYDHADITALAGATLALEFLYVLAANQR